MNRKRIGIILVIMAVIVGSIVGYYHERPETNGSINASNDQKKKLEQQQDEKCKELVQQKGRYDEKTIVLSDTNESRAKALADKMGASVRMTSDKHFAVLTLPKENVEAFKEVVDEWRQTFIGEYGSVEKDLKLDVEDVERPAHIVPSEIQDNLVDALCACHNGVFRMIPDVPGIVETSSNLAIVEIGGGKAMFKILIRSSRDSMRECLAESLESAFSMAGMKVELSGDYPAWQPNPHSEIVELMKSVYKELFGTDNKVQVVHAGLECGVIGAWHPMDMVSFGPTLRSPHTPNERCNIPSVEKYWKFVLTTLERTPRK